MLHSVSKGVGRFFFFFLHFREHCDWWHPSTLTQHVANFDRCHRLLGSWSTYLPSGNQEFTPSGQLSLTSSMMASGILSKKGKKRWPLVKVWCCACRDLRSARITPFWMPKGCRVISGQYSYSSCRGIREKFLASGLFSIERVRGTSRNNQTNLEMQLHFWYMNEWD